MRNYIVGIVFSIILLISGILFPKESPKQSQECLGKVFAEVEEIARSKYQLYASGTFVASPDGILQKAGLDFDCYQQLTKDEYKFILTDLAMLLVDKINKNVNLQKCTPNPSFTIEDIDITLFINKNYGDYYYPDLSIASLKYGYYVFKTNDPESKYKYKTQEKEPYQ